ncbi:hypothetical protein DAMA08_016690 [Martiniozyma asiatica (nom. inval.)]|nr:hypothetical protein DAMA08_016690 [Martiniozyma asiatica]
MVDIARISEIQRRTKASESDVEVAVELGLPKKFGDLFRSKLADVNMDVQRDPPVQIIRVAAVGEYKEQRLPVESWFPPLPPVHTYKHTGVFTQRIEDLRMLREKIVVEGRLGEKALGRLNEAEGSNNRVESDDELFDDSQFSDEEQEQEQEKEQKQDLQTSNEIKIQENGQIGLLGEARVDEQEVKIDDKDNNKVNSNTSKDIGNEMGSAVVSNLQDKNTENKPETSVVAIDTGDSFDIPKYAKHRLALLETRRQKNDELLKARREGREAKLGRWLGNFSSESLPDDISIQLTAIRKSTYKKLISGLKLHERKYNKWMEDIEIQRKKMSEMNKPKIVEEEIHFEDQLEEIDMDVDMDLLDFAMEEMENIDSVMPDNEEDQQQQSLLETTESI